MSAILQTIKKIPTQALKYTITNLCPLLYTTLFYKKNTNRKLWNGKKSCVSLSFDCDYTKDIMALAPLLDTLSAYSFKTSFACIGKFIEKYPKEHQRIVWEGHEIINHTYSHPNSDELNPNQKFNDLTNEQITTEIETCHTVCKDILGYAPAGFRTPHFANEHLQEVYDILGRLGYKYSSSISATASANAGNPFMAHQIAEFPLSACPRHPFVIFDSWHSLVRGNGNHKTPGEFYTLFKKLIDTGIETNSYINIYFDPQDVIGLEDFKLMLDYLEEKKQDIWVATYKDIFEKMHAL